MIGARSRPKLLVTGFGPFPGVPFNASAALVQSLKYKAGLLSLDLHTSILPTHWRDSPLKARALMEALKPDAVIHFGVSSQASDFQFEMLAFNHCNKARDHVGRLSDGFHVQRGGFPKLHATLPADYLLRRLRLAGIAASLSHDAGRYLCNATLYASLYRALCFPKTAAPLTGFIHIPAFSDPDFGSAASGFGWSELHHGAVEILKALEYYLRGNAYRSGRDTGNRLHTGSAIRRRPIA